MAIEKERFRKISVRMYSDARFLALSAPKPSAQSLWVYLLTGPHTTQIPGLFSAGRAGLAEALSWSLEDFDACWGEIEAQGLARADWKARLVFIPRAIFHNGPESPNVVTSWRDTWPLLPECNLKWDAYRDLRAALASISECYAKAFVDACLYDLPKATPNPSPKASGKASGNPRPNQEQEQEQEQETTFPREALALPSAGGQAAPDPTEPTPSAALLVPDEPEWAPALREVRAELDGIAAPKVFYQPGYWVRVIQTYGGDDCRVVVFRELRKYLLWLEPRPKRHRNMLAGFRNWLAKAEVLEENRAQRQAFTAQRNAEYPGRNRG